MREYAREQRNSRDKDKSSKGGSGRKNYGMTHKENKLIPKI